MNNKYYNKTNINLFIIVFTLIIFLTKWYYPYFYFNETIESKLIFESVSDGYYYFAQFKALANLSLNNSFHPLINNLGTITIPTGAFIFHFIFHLIIGLYSFVILEFIFILFFLIIFYKISRLLNLNRIQSLAVAILLFNIPNIFQFLNINNLVYFNIISAEFYSLRFPRPLVVNVYFFLFIFLILKSDEKNFFTIKNSLIFGTLSSLLFTSYFHAFCLIQVALIFYLFFRFRSKIIKTLKKNIKYILLYLLIFILVSSPFLTNMFFAEADFLERIGLVVLDFNKKLILLKYLSLKLFKIQFIFIFVLSILLLFLLNRINNFINCKKINIFFIIFYSSIITPFIFIFVSPSFSSHFYHFTNLVLLSGFILFFYIFIILFDFLIKKKISINSINNFSFLLIFILFIWNIYISNKNYKLINLDNERFIERTEFNSIIDIIKKENILDNKNISLLTFDNRFLVWSILSDIKYLNIINGVLVPRTNNMIENDLINTFKFLNLSKNDFRKFIQNKKLSSWRYRNENIRDSFWMRYQANALVTFDDSKNFDPEILEFINKSSPLLSQQLIIPNDEFQRLLSKFNNVNNSSLFRPNVIIINKENIILKKSYIDNDIFCKAFEGKIYDLYYSFEINDDCVR
jgi:hypothetical protein